MVMINKSCKVCGIEMSWNTEWCPNECCGCPQPKSDEYSFEYAWRLYIGEWISFQKAAEVAKLKLDEWMQWVRENKKKKIEDD